MVGIRTSFVVFDCDGVILDSMGKLEDLAVDILVSSYDMEEFKARKRYRETTGIPFKDQLAVLFDNTSKNQFAAALYEIQHEKECTNFALGKDVKSMLSWLRKEGFCYALISSTSKRIISKTIQLQELNFDWIGGWEPDFTKREQLIRAGFFMGKRPEEVLFVSDSQSDRKVAKDVGTKFLLSVADTVADDIPKLLGRVVPA